ncbi:MAG: putative toxin-antitoxin system toxin component, PIN family [Gammaproteobacteria bacterium]|nr:putative toxin-antitoxin system toxin component, PIN family [Gammaproteobacteria bacterium]
MPGVAVVDTNVVVSGLLTRKFSSPLVTIVEGMLAGRFPFVLSPSLLDEYRRVLLRNKIRALHGLSEDEVDRILVELVANAMWHDVSPEWPAAPDPGDDHLWRLLNTLDAGVLVTGDQLLLDNPPDTASVLSPRSFVDSLL